MGEDGRRLLEDVNKGRLLTEMSELELAQLATQLGSGSGERNLHATQTVMTQR